MKEKFINLKNKIVSSFIDLKNKMIPFIIVNKKIAIAILVVLVIIIAVIIAMCGKKEIGNTSGNLSNLGFSVDKGGWVYYLGYDEGISDGIYKVKR